MAAAAAEHLPAGLHPILTSPISIVMRCEKKGSIFFSWEMYVAMADNKRLRFNSCLFQALFFSISFILIFSSKFLTLQKWNVGVAMAAGIKLHEALTFKIQ